MDLKRRPVTLMIAALGGQGGGVVADWLIDVARRERHLVQATSVPGVAQRTGATFYYLEFFPETALPGDGRRPVMALMPSPGDVDIVVAAEALEAARTVERGFVTADRTTLIASTHRVYTIAEKSALGDGRADAGRLAGEVERSAKAYVGFDMAAIAEQTGALVSAVLLGAVAGAGVLPFNDDAYRAAIRATAKSVDANLAAFEAGSAASRAAVESRAAAPVASGPKHEVQVRWNRHRWSRRCRRRWSRASTRFPSPCDRCCVSRRRGWSTTRTRRTRRNTSTAWPPYSDASRTRQASCA